jgi:hypothetical protein
VNQTDFFAKKLGAPLRNFLWSWGAVHPEGRAVFLKVWQDKIRMHKGCRIVQITFRHLRKRNGHRERLEHVDLIRGGAKCYLIMCKAKDRAARRRRVIQFNAEKVFPGGRILPLEDGELWVKVLPAVDIQEVMLSPRRKPILKTQMAPLRS